MLHATARQDVRAIGTFLADSGYDAKQLAEELLLSEGLYANHENLEPLLLKTSDDALLPLLARLFFVGWPVGQERCATFIPEPMLCRMFNCGLLTRAGDNLESAAVLIPFRNHLIACDNPRLRANSPDFVVGPSGSSTQFLARLLIAGENETSLDIGSGSGVLALHSATFSRHVTGTDINARTLPFASFSAALNGIANAEFLCGDAFAPVAGRRFSRIIANPPFFLSPATKFTYCDSPLALDGFAQRLAMEAPAYLEEGGYFQMICQWVDLEQEAWEHRLTQWTAQSHCDVLVLLAPRLTPIAYAEVRAKEARHAQSTPAAFTFADRVHYLRKHGVTSVVSGVITMRKRSGAGNWFSTLNTDPAGPNVGHGIVDRFDSLTFLATHNPEQIFSTRFRFAPDVQLETITEPGEPQWTATSIELVKSETLIDRLRLDTTIAGCLPFFDGQQNLSQVAQAVADKLAITPQEARNRCLQLTRRLLQTSYLETMP